MPSSRYSEINASLNQPWPIARLISKIILGSLFGTFGVVLGIALPLTGLTASAPILGFIIPALSGIGLGMLGANYIYNSLNETFFGKDIRVFSVKSNQNEIPSAWYLKTINLRSGLLKLLGIEAPVKTTSDETESQLKQDLKEILKTDSWISPAIANPATLEQTATTLSKQYTLEILNQQPVSFYENDTAEAYQQRNNIRPN